ncbi:Trans-hexaprenyltranstransferase [Thermodesulfobium narugense DSM 14796]|uniref:Trans-hexaprenyltranstransferase n=1 Tax=Thermodesulfobium narugense DSM 14796 TaxID=747365 RepID=M1E5J4_9BACT|nr:polyprenyl synthetase family protein [Thermodesulfobium narugense]AEE13660.1 Trans-hexaprenyltranstransferase [Thermodesulfobium narugense DSM 14796]
MNISTIGLELKSHIKLSEIELARILETEVETLRNASLHLLEAGGKRIRPTLVFLSALCVNQDIEKVIKYAAVVEGIHLATLIHDDVIDESNVRRGILSVNGKYGFKVAILSGDFILAKITHFLSLLENKEPVRLMAEVIMRMAEGEVMQQEDLFKIVSIERYIIRCTNKTARLISSSAFLGSIDVLDKRNIFAEFGLNLGIAFQIIDDILDFTGEVKKLGKVPGSDLRSGVVTLPVLLLSKKSREVEKLLEKKFEDGINKIIEMVKNDNVLKESVDLAKYYSNKAIECLKELKINNIYAKTLMDYVKMLEERVS